MENTSDQHEHTAVPARRGIMAEATFPSLVVRLVLTLAASALLFVGAATEWFRGIDGVDLRFEAFYRTQPGTTDSFFGSAGFAVIVLGLVAIFGLAFSSGWLTRLAGALGLVGFAMVLIQLARSDELGSVNDVGLGLWLLLAGGLLALIGGFLVRRPVLRTNDDQD